MRQILSVFSFVFVYHLASAQSFSHQWTNNLDSVAITVLGIAADSNDDVILIGEFSNTVDFDPGPAVASYTSSGMFNSDAFIAKYSTTGAFLWVKVISSPTRESFEQVVIASNNEIIVSGTYYGNTDLDPGTGTATAIHNGNSGADFLLARYNSNGDYVWSKYWGGIGTEFTGALQINNAGSILVAGAFTGTCDLDPGAGTQYFYAAGGNLDYDVFMSCFTSTGNLSWCWQLGGANSESISSIAVDASDNIFCTGRFTGPIDFDPGAGQYNITGSFGFVSRLTPTGGFTWVGTFDFNPGFVEVTPQQEVFIAGNYVIPIDADPGAGVYTLPHVGGYETGIIALTTAGNFIRAGCITGTAHQFTNDFKLDVNGNFALGGQFEAAADFDPGAGVTTLTPATYRDPFVIVVDSLLNLVSALHIPCVGGEGYTNKIATDQSGNVYFHGRFFGTADFDPTAGNFFLTNNAQNQATFFSKYSLMTGISEVQGASGLSCALYPNPCTNELHLYSANPLTDVSVNIYDVQEKLISEELELSGNRIVLNIAELEPGMYVAVVKEGDVEQSLRFIKR